MVMAHTSRKQRADAMQEKCTCGSLCCNPPVFVLCASLHEEGPRCCMHICSIFNLIELSVLHYQHLLTAMLLTTGEQLVPVATVAALLACQPRARTCTMCAQ